MMRRATLFAACAVAPGPPGGTLIGGGGGPVLVPTESDNTSAPSSGPGPNWGCGDFMQPGNLGMTQFCVQCLQHGCGDCAKGPNDCGVTSQATTRQECYDDTNGDGLWCRPCVNGGHKECGCEGEPPCAGPDTPSPTSSTPSPTSSGCPGGAFPAACNGRACPAGQTCDICIGPTLAVCVGGSTPSPTSTTPSPTSSTPSPTSARGWIPCDGVGENPQADDPRCCDKGGGSIMATCHESCNKQCTVTCTCTDLVQEWCTSCHDTEAPTEWHINMSGDPFTTYGGKQTQFYLPLGSTGRRAQPTSLMACEGVEIMGRAFGSGIAGDSQQWFGGFDILQNGRTLASIEVADMRHLTGDDAIGAGALAAAAAARKRAATLLADAAAATAMDGENDVTVAKVVETRVAAALQAMHFAEAARSTWQGGNTGTTAKPLTTLNVTVLGRKVTHTEAETVSNGGADAFIAVSQDTNIRIGSGYSETVAIGVENVGVEFTSSVAQKLNGTQAVLMTHIDLRFTQIRVTQCTGPLPEIWGVRPMSRKTAAMLLPPKV